MIRQFRIVLACAALLFGATVDARAGDLADSSAGAEDAATTNFAPFAQGQTDRRAWESWLSEQTGDNLAGASFWAAHRSLSNPPDCVAIGGGNGAWVEGCNTAREKLANSDELRHSSPEYKLGWNSILAPNAATPVASPAISASSQVLSPPPTDVGEANVNIPPSNELPVPIVPLTAGPAASLTFPWLQILLWATLLLLIVVGIIVLLARGKPSAEEQLRILLLPDETIIEYAMQHRLYALLSRRNLAAVTTGRFIFLRRRLLGGFVMFDMRWQDIKDAKLSVGMFSASVRLHYSANLSDTAMNESNVQAILASGLVIKPAQAVYRECQAQEQSWREKRRVRAIEEMRAKAGGVQIATGIYPPGLQTLPDPQQAAPAMETLTHKLAQARDMKAQGLITDSEYEAIKARVVQSI